MKAVETITPFEVRDFEVRTVGEVDLANVHAYMATTPVRDMNLNTRVQLDRCYEFTTGVWAVYSQGAFGNYRPVRAVKYRDKVFPAPVVFFSPAGTEDVSKYVKVGELIDLL